MSMVSARILSQVHQRLNQVTDTPDGFFGNIGVILLGDFLQLRPVCAKSIFSKDCTELEIVPDCLHLYRSLFKPVFLTISQRQRGDQHFAHLLQRARRGQLTDEDEITLNCRSLNLGNPHLKTIKALLQTEFSKATWLFPYKKSANSHNQQELRKLSIATGAPIVTVCAVDEGKIALPKDADVDATGGLPFEVSLTKGAVVMLRHNIDVADGLYNGAQGTIASIEETSGSIPTVIFIHFSDPRVGLMAERKEIEGKMAVRVDPKTIAFDYQGQQVKRTQLPVILSFAITIHKAQGLTLDKVVADCSEGMFEAGMAYTAISRVRRLEDLIFVEFSPLAFKVSDSAIEELERLGEVVV